MLHIISYTTPVFAIILSGHNVSISSAITELSTLLGQGLSCSKADLDAHGQSESYFDTIPPNAVAYPTSTEQVSDILTICARNACPVIGYGAGTSLEGQTTAVVGGISVDFSKMTSVIEVCPGDLIVRVQPGCTREDLNAYLRETGLFFPVDPGANASLGGMAATRASGTTAVRYGTMRQNVLALEVVLADGRIIRTGSAAPKTSAGYDLTGLIVGSEGTLGLITELTLRLQGIPEAISTAVCAFPEISNAVDAVTETIQMGLQMARIEFLDAESVACINAYSDTNLDVMPQLLVEFHGSDGTVAEQIETFRGIANSHDALGFEWATATEDRNKLWQARHHAYFAALASKPGARAIVTDLCVPISRLAEAIDETRADIDASIITGPMLGHVGDGNIHALLLLDENNAEEVKEAKALAKRMAERALRLGGTVTGEHGIGMGKIPFMAAEHGEGWSIMGDIKRAMDPQNILNPGKMVQVN
jgi:D-lactate dehydrogenase (cytochrome)